MGMGLTMGTLFCIIQVGPMLSHMSGEVKERQNRDETVPKKKKEEEKKVTEKYKIVGFKD